MDLVILLPFFFPLQAYLVLLKACGNLALADDSFFSNRIFLNQDVYIVFFFFLCM